MLLLFLPQVHPRLLDGHRIRRHSASRLRSDKGVGLWSHGVKICEADVRESMFEGLKRRLGVMGGRECRRECHGSRNSPRSESEAMGTHEMFTGSVVLM
jgi:hypothetical protein